jgi:hypothetical protein
MATISKAQLKRDADKKSLIRSRVSKKLIDFKNQYIGDFVNYEVAQIKDVANSFKGSDMKKVESQVIGKTLREVKLMDVFSNHELSCMTLSCELNGQWLSYRTPDNDRIVDGVGLGSVKEAKRKLELLDTYKVGFYADALKSYEAKIDKVVDKMCQYDFNRHLEVDDVSDIGSDFEILVWNPKTENVYTSDRDKKLEGVEFFFHARLIYANGMINRPHFRFITTTRKTYLTK